MPWATRTQFNQQNHSIIQESMFLNYLQREVDTPAVFPVLNDTCCLQKFPRGIIQNILLLNQFIYDCFTLIVNLIMGDASDDDSVDNGPPPPQDTARSKAQRTARYMKQAQKLVRCVHGARWHAIPTNLSCSIPLFLDFLLPSEIL